MSWTRSAGACTGVLLSLLCLCLAGTGRAAATTERDDGERTGQLTIEVGWDAPRQEPKLRTRCTYTLAPDSDALARIRETGEAFCGGFSVAYEGQVHMGVGAGFPRLEVTQRSPRDTAWVETEDARPVTFADEMVSLKIAVDMASRLEHQPAGLPAVWRVEVRAPRWSFSEIQGLVESQSPDAITWEVATGSRDGPSVLPSVRLDRREGISQPTALRTWGMRGEQVMAFGGAVCAIGVVAALLVARLVGPAVRRRWMAATLVAAATVYFLTFGIQESLWFQAGTATSPQDHTATASATAGSRVWVPGPVLGLGLWYVLPVAGWWFSRRLATGRPPSGPELAVSGATPLLLLPVVPADGARPSTTGWWTLAVVCLVPVVVTLVMSHRGGPAARRWAATAGTLLGIVGLTYWIGHAPLMSRNWVTLDVYATTAVMVCTWPAAAWLTSLTGPVLGRTLHRAVRACCFVVLWGLLVAPFLKARTTEEISWAALSSASPFAGYAGFPLGVVAVGGVALQLVYLRRLGRPGDRGRAVEPVGRVLLVCGVLTALGSPSLRTVTIWGDAAALLFVALASIWLIPCRSDPAADEFRRVGRKAHARLMHRWVRTQLLWDARADFQRTARSSLAEDMNVSDLSRRWRELDVPGHWGDPAARLARAKRYALGTNAGSAPWRAGLAGAAVTQVLALPWAVHQALTGDLVGADNFMPFHLEEISRTLRFGHWALYGFVFGYFYALLRGGTPIAKAASLMAVVLPAEVLAVAPLAVDPEYTLNPSWTDTAVTCGVLAGQVLVICMVLGLAWEWWLARAAALKWSQVRNFRRLSSVTVPLGTVLVAAATAFVTTVAGAWTQQELQSPSGSPSSSPAAPVQPGQPGR
ncbi:hypothetical protein [Streptomyces sp. TRM75561]|uniref:hypothetical protein n=1 Tax=Streptomyces sp. TRM75561 TaxID=2975269 RepID=UPI00244CD227|nr:hypothetical protein [Streptomyces sp. TRM75561]MDH3037328.1 hypothetical protein [Streptomyces sp. TRM75561]